MFKVNRRCSGVLIVNFEHISHLSLSASIVDSDQVNVNWEIASFYFTTK